MIKRNVYYFIAVLTFTCFVSIGRAQTGPIKRKNLQDRLIDQFVHRTEMQEIILAKGQLVPEHVHPCPVIGLVTSGQILFQIEGQAAVILRKGDAFYEPKNTLILHFDNMKTHRKATFVAIYLKEANEPNIIIPDERAQSLKIERSE